ncbi:MAG: hypothetical protein RMJ97_12100, partial [Raineya sp.]|nr:hypothetical protein [Raineya sp.]
MEKEFYYVSLVYYKTEKELHKITIFLSLSEVIGATDKYKVLEQNFTSKCKKKNEFHKKLTNIFYFDGNFCADEQKLLSLRLQIR